MTKDNAGNKLSEGNFVQVTLPSGVSALRGRIKSISEGRITRIGGARKSEADASVQPGLVTVEIILPVESHPETGVAPNIIRIWNPTGKDLEAEAKTLQHV
ncbi:MAG TPA: hypothetical protein VFB79_21435 [Candidatus Angelobacter sp.]|nr:hypothetical protein [Candidatus Angelobacter sp.]